MYNKKEHIHFVGIGGIGMSGIATILRYQGYTISGCDRDLDQQSIKNLLAIGCTIFEGNYSYLCQRTPFDILVYSSAIQSNHPEIIMAQKRGIPTIARPLMLAELMRTKYSVAIAGSHGKTTTTSLIAHILIESKMDPTVIIGGHLKTISNNARIGTGNFLVAEMDESDRSIEHLHATIALVTNIDLEHLDVYRDLDDIKQSFIQFLNNIPFYGKAILCLDDLQIRSLPSMPHIKIIYYGLNSDAHIYGVNVQLYPDYSTCTVMRKDQSEPLGNLTIPIPGKHNVLNALGAVTLALDLELPFTHIVKALSSFKGVDRRFTYRGTFKTTQVTADVYDDYGHHPREIEQTLLVAQRKVKNKLTVIFQPHRYTRVHKLWNDFIETFYNSTIDHLIITDLYSAHEAPIPQVNSICMVATLMAKNPSFKVTYVPYDPHGRAFKEILSQTIEDHDLILCLGAGSITKLSRMLV